MGDIALLEMIEDLPRDILEDIVFTFCKNIEVSHGLDHPWIPGAMNWSEIRALLGPLYPSTKAGW